MRDNKKINFPVKDSSGNTHEMTVYFTINEMAKSYKKATCYYCKERRSDVHNDSITADEVLLGNIVIKRKEELFIKSEQKLVKLFELPRRKYCLKENLVGESCTDTHLRFIVDVGEFVEN